MISRRDRRALDEALAGTPRDLGAGPVPEPDDGRPALAVGRQWSPDRHRHRPRPWQPPIGGKDLAGAADRDRHHGPPGLHG